MSLFIVRSQWFDPTWSIAPKQSQKQSIINYTSLSHCNYKLKNCGSNCNYFLILYTFSTLLTALFIFINSIPAFHVFILFLFSLQFDFRVYDFRVYLSVQHKFNCHYNQTCSAQFTCSVHDSCISQNILLTYYHFV